jgi:hypothetical protein
MYWQVYDEIEIPPEVVASIMEKGSKPESITRGRRKTQIKEDKTHLIN